MSTLWGILLAFGIVLLIMVTAPIWFRLLDPILEVWVRYMDWAMRDRR